MGANAGPVGSCVPYVRDSYAGTGAAAHAPRQRGTIRHPEANRWHLPHLSEELFSRTTRELQLLPGSLAPRQYEHLVHLASCLPFEQAARMLGDLLGVQVNTESTRRLTEYMGAWMDVAQLEDAEPVPHDLSVSASPPGCEQRVLSVDGAMISLEQKQWVEVRTVAIGEPANKPGTDGKAEVHVNQPSYFSSLSDASTFDSPGPKRD